VTEFTRPGLQIWLAMNDCCDRSTWLNNMGNLSHRHQVGDIEHGSIMQGHYARELVEVSLIGIQYGLPRQGFCASGLVVVAWRCFTYEPMERLCTLVQQGHGLG